MSKKLVLISIPFFFFIYSQAQSFTLSGRVQDAETKSGIQVATVLLKSIGDSSITSTTYTDIAGRFQFDQLQKDSFRITISSIGFETLTRSVMIDSVDVDMGIIAVPKTSKELSGVTVTATTPPVQQKGDTVQINASQYKVNPDASAEDLVRKMPGITVENGVVKAQGENVQKVTIDGRELFGDDATAALRNLPAEIIDKIQVFDRLSDQAQATGFDDGNTQKGINIITKANMRNGQFGRVYAGYGTDERYHAGGNATFLKENRKIALVGNFNNVNQQNFSQQDLLGVTSNNDRGGRGSGGPRGGGQGSGGPRGGRGGNPGGGQGSFGNNSNFLVGQQNGINKTNALGINYSDLWGKKITVSGSYFFNNTNNTTDQLSTTEYFLEGIPDNKQSTQANSRNSNHWFNMRFEYRIDSSNQITITPNLSFQDNTTNRMVSTSSFRSLADIIRETNNVTNSTRSGNNVSNNILYRHSFPKRGRTFSINLNTSYNKRVGDTYVTTQETEYNSSGINDTTTQRFTDQINGGHQISTNLVYTEPLSENSQLQFNYNPSFSKSTSDQETFGMNPSDNKYSLFLDSLSNKFENKTRAHNAGTTYRYGNRDRQISFGVNYQQTNLYSDQTFPETLTVDKSFQNFLPNAQIRYKLSPKSSIRINYRSNTNQPSVTQLQNVVDPTNSPFFTAGNPDLEQQYMHILSTQYTFTNSQKALLFVANVFAQKANNYITNATFAPTKDSIIGNKILLKPGQQLTMPVNLDGYASLRSFLTFAVPLKFIKSNFNLNGGVSFFRQPGVINNTESLSRNYTYTLGSVIASNVSQYIDFTVSYSANFNKVRSETESQLNNDYFSQVASLQLNLLSKTGWFFQNDLNNQRYTGLTEGFNQNYFLWNMSVGKKILKDRKGELKLSVFDLLKQNQSITRNVTETYIQDISNEVLTQYFMLTFTYNLRNFGKAPVRANNRGGGMNYRF
jgi:uncharacterized membrane protein YgcG